MPRVSAERFRGFVALGIAARLLLIVYGLVQDNYFTVKYTDVDYFVVTDGAALLARGESPFDRTTYRYSPILAALLLPNIWIHECVGKLLFCLADIIVALLVRQTVLVNLTKSHHESSTTVSSNAVPEPTTTTANNSKSSTNSVPAIEKANFWALAWLLNPLPASISSRGNADSLVLALVLTVVLLTLQQRPVRAGLVFGLAVHFRLYPIIYAPALALHFFWSRPPLKWTWQIAVRKALAAGLFGLVGAVTCLTLTGGTYYYFGYKGLCHALLSSSFLFAVAVDCRLI